MLRKGWLTWNEFYPTICFPMSFFVLGHKTNEIAFVVSCMECRVWWLRYTWVCGYWCIIVQTEKVLDFNRRRYPFTRGIIMHFIIIELNSGVWYSLESCFVYAEKIQSQSNIKLYKWKEWSGSLGGVILTKKGPRLQNRLRNE